LYNVNDFYLKHRLWPNFSTTYSCRRLRHTRVFYVDISTVF